MENKTWNRVLLARDPKRPTASAVIKAVFDDFIELHGDRLIGDDKSIIGGIATFKGKPVTVIAQEKGTSTQSKVFHNFGMPHPEGYHKALRLMKQAEKFHRPIITIIDTPGAYPGIEAEERGQAHAIASSIQEMIKIKTPIISIVLGEGGSGGALAIGVSDVLAMFENSVFSVVSPEGFASILFKDSNKAPEVSDYMKITANDLKDLKVIDEIIAEEVPLSENAEPGLLNLSNFINKQLKALNKLPIGKLLNKRNDKYRNIGTFELLSYKDTSQAEKDDNDE